MHTALLVALAGAVWPVTACTAYESCQVAAGLEQNRYSREAALDRCEQVANREYAEKVRQEGLRRQRAVEEARANERVEAEAQRWAAQREQAKADVRRSPRAPELGATPSESASLCRSQGGVQQQRPAEGEDRGMFYGCLIDGLVIFVAQVRANDNVISRVRTFYEGRDLTETRDRIEREFGAASTVEVVDGYRAWTWNRSKITLTLQGYSRGLLITATAHAESGTTAEEPQYVMNDREKLLAPALQTVCNTGVVRAQAVLPDHPDAGGLLERGYLSCQGAITRWQAEPGGLAAIEHPVDFVCGYAIGAMFAKYGLAHEVEGKLSRRAMVAARACIEAMAKQGITNKRLSGVVTTADASPQ